ncbi:hypothetical protein D3C76_775860 [compost metagenome]
MGTESVGASCRSEAIMTRIVKLHFVRPKAATDKAESTGNIREAMDQLGHTTVVMTEHYIRTEKGRK